MRIGFDISQTGQAKAGCGWFADSLIRHLAEIDTQNEYILYPTFGDSYWDTEGPAATAQIDRPNFRRGLSHATLAEAQQFWRNPGDDFEARLGEPDIVHANNFFCPHGLSQARLVYTLHDLMFLEQPESTTEANRNGCFTGVFHASLHADLIVAVSQYSRRHFLDIFPHYPSDRVAVAHLASRFHRQPDCARPAKLARLRPGRFWLTVGTIEPRKNHRRLLQAYARLKAQLGESFPLVLAGGKGWLMEDFESFVDKLGLRKDIVVLGYVEEAELQWLYQNCFAFLYPSLFEGFGLPVLEAMTLGAPVIASNTTSLPEIVGAAGLLVDPLEEEAILDAMHRLATGQIDREVLCAQAMARAREFSWDSTAKQVVGFYQQVVTRPRLGQPEQERLRSTLERVASNWEQFGKDDPLWAVLTWPEKKGNKWTAEEFFEVGQRDMESLMAYLQSIGVKLRFGSALDFGSGAGRLSQALAAHFAEVHGVDISASMVQAAERLNRHPGRCRYHLNQVEDLHLFPDDVFDFVLSLITLQHVPCNLALKYIAEFVRTTAPGGVIVFQVPDSRRDAPPVPVQDRGEEIVAAKEASMIMSGVPHDEVVQTLTRWGARLVDSIEDECAGPQWLSYRYCAVKLDHEQGPHPAPSALQVDRPGLATPPEG